MARNGGAPGADAGGAAGDGGKDGKGRRCSVM